MGRALARVERTEAREEIPGPFMPAPHAGEALGENGREIATGTGIGLVEDPLPGLKAGMDALLDKADDEASHGELRAVEGAAVIGNHHAFDPPHALEEFDASRSAGLAEARALDNIPKTERILGQKEGVIDQGHRPRQADGVRHAAKIGRQGLGYQSIGPNGRSLRHKCQQDRFGRRFKDFRTNRTL